ncbi:MAG TPA: MFS transporter [Polyangia bacterium]|nr:MFS transporter [Polyangia bacterium]
MIEVFYFFFFMAIGIYLPYLPPYLQGLGLTGREISTVLSVSPVMALAIPLFWAWIADRTRQHARVLKIVCAGACLGFLPLLFVQRFPAIFATYVGYSLFAVAIGGLADSLAIARVRAGGDYGRLRVWGSLGCMVATLVGGAILTARGGRGADPLVPRMLCLALAAAFIASLRLRGTGEQSARPRLNDVKVLLRDGRFRLLLVAAALHWMCCAPYHVFFGILLRDRQLSPNVIGVSFCIGVAAEIVVLFAFKRLRRLMDLEAMLMLACAGSAVRWFAISQAHNTPLLMGLQALHGLTFGLFWGAGITLVGECVPAPLRATGQALFVMAITGIGNIVGMLTAGALYDATGSATALFFAAAFTELLPLGVLHYGRRRVRALNAGAA